ncbi:MAG: sulfite exporter TauE/SafE family protein [Opitutaceae bacterium]|nr:sulfite exporter TauE/SafE family protein [Opitutaceae bacterium]
MTLSDASTLVLLSFTGSAHCAGMCGGFALAASSPSVRAGMWARLLAHHAGKTLSYVSVGLILLLFLEHAWASGIVARVQDVLGWLLAASLLGLGVAQVIGWRWQAPWESRLGSMKSGCNVGVLGQTGVVRAGLIGWLNGFLPCGLSLSAMLLVLRSRDVGEVAVGLALFGLGTLPILAATVVVGSRLSVPIRLRLARLSGWLLVVLALITFLRATELGRAWLHAGFGWLPGAPVDPWCR